MYPDPSTISFGNILNYINTVMENAFGILFLVILFAIFYNSMNEVSAKKAFATAAFLVLPFAIFFYILSIINLMFLVLFILLSIIGYLNLKE